MLYNENYYKTLKQKYTHDTPWKRNRIKNVMDLLVSINIKKSVIIDLACGIGTFTVELYREKAFVIGLDNSFNAVTVSSTLFQEVNHSKGCFVTSDALSLPFSESSVDIILCADFIEHISAADYSDLLIECWRILKPRGYIVIYTPNRWHFLELMMRNNIFLKKDESHIDIKSMERVVNPLKNAGFILLRQYYRPTHIIILRWIESILMYIPIAGELFRRRICVLARKQLQLEQRS